MTIASSDALIGEMNTTPLIDVLLVLLVMLIMTIPVATHKVSIDLPTSTPPTITVDAKSNDLHIDRAGVARWNGRAVDDASLAALLAEAGRLAPAPEVHFRPDAETRYERVDAVLTMSKKAHVTKLGFVGNGAYAAF